MMHDREVDSDIVAVKPTTQRRATGAGAGGAKGGDREDAGEQSTHRTQGGLV